MERNKKLYTAIAIIAASTIITSCGSSDSVTGQNAPTRQSGTLAGVAHDAPLRNAEVKIYDFSSGSKGELLSQTVTDSSGDYSINITTPDKPILIVAGDSGSYTEEASGRSIKLAEGQNISAVTYYQSGETLSLQVTPFTHLARCYAEYLVSDGESVPDALNLANSKIASVAGVEIIKTKPVDVTDINSANIELTPGLKYGFLTAGISASMVDVSEANGFDPHSQRFLTSMQYSKVACNDIRADGLLDGKGYIDDSTIGALSFGTYNITSAFYRNTLAQRILSFARSDRNVTGLDIAKLLVFANALSNNTDSMWAGLPAQSVDITGPTIEAQIAANSYIGGAAEIPFLIDDPIGIEKIDFYVDDALVSSQSGDSQTLTINTANYLDGPHEFKVVAADILDNQTTKIITYNVVNTGPGINLTSDIVTGAVSYIAQGTWVSTGAAIKAITVNGEDATVNPDGTWSALVRLENGNNTIGVSATDELDNKTTKSYVVGLDRNNPLITELVRSVRQTTYNGQYNLCNYVSFGDTSTDPICIRSDRVSLNGFAVDGDLDGNDFMYLKFRAEDTAGAGVYSQFEDLTVEYRYKHNDTIIKDWQKLTTGYKSTIPGALYGTFIIPITTEFLGEDWYKSTLSDIHVVTVKVTDSVGNVVERDYTMQFDVLIYDVDLSGSTTGSDVMNQSFSNRSTINNNQVITTAEILNTTDSVIYLNYSSAHEHSLTQTYETAIRENKANKIMTTHWVGLSQTTNQWGVVRSVWDGVTETSTTVPEPVNLGAENIDSEILPALSDSPQEFIPEYSCEWGAPNLMHIAPSQYYSYHRYLNFYGYEFEDGTAGDNGAMVGCVIFGYDSDNIFKNERNLKRYYSYYYEQIEGFPRTNLSETTLNYDIANSVTTVTTVGEVNVVDGYYEIHPEASMTITKTISLPAIINYDDAEISDLDAFVSYEQKRLDKNITYYLDESVDLEILAVKGASPYLQTIGSQNTYTISR